ncbi:hypothetical protein B0J17DRAFT_301620 [Rhizoctonia solani]|nr:hypothetical protein B0J17DRAFT_301620 [Rhizoctonia solani]
MSGVPISHRTNTWVQGVGSIQHWEEPGARLESAITTYLESCMALEKLTTPFSLGTRNLSIRLDRRLEYFHALLTQPLAESYSCVARTKNKLAAIYQLPSEVLTRIFQLATYHTLSEDELDIDYALTTIYRSLYRIISVCSVWRNTALPHRALWTVIPLFYDNSLSSLRNETLVRVHLERAGCLKLYLAVNMGHRDNLAPLVEDTLVANRSRFGSMNIFAKSTNSIKNILKCFTKLGSPLNIDEMSLCTKSYSPNQRTAPPLHRIFDSNLVHRATLERIVSSLRILRMRGVRLPTENIIFNNLVELRIQDVNLGRDTTVIKFLPKLIHASHLHTLEMILVTAKENEKPLESITPLTPFLSLKKFYLEDLMLNVMRAVLRSMVPGPYRFILGIIDNC